MNKLWKMLRKKDVGAIGIGAMIVFIAMVLVAGIAASVLIQTSNTIQSQAMSTGQATTREVSSGIGVFDIEGKINITHEGTPNETKADMKYLAITVKARPGSDDIDLNNTYILLSDGNKKALLRYGYNQTGLFQNDADGNVFDILDSTQWNLSNKKTFGIAVIQDYDNSIKRYTPVLNRGDKAILLVRCSPEENGTFDAEIPERTDVFGQVIPEVGSPGVIAFTTPMSYPDVIYDLQ